MRDALLRARTNATANCPLQGSLVLIALMTRLVSDLAPVQLVLLLGAALALGACGETADEETPADDTPTDQDDNPDTPNPPNREDPRCDGSADYINIAGAQSLDPILQAPQRCLLYGLDRTGNTVYYIDIQDDAVRHAVVVGNRPTDLAMSPDGERLFVSVFGDQQVVMLDAASGAELSRVDTDKPPYRLAHGTDRRVFYVSDGPFTDVREVNFVNGQEIAKTSVAYQEPDLVASADGTSLFLGESNVAGAELLHFATSEPGFPAVDEYRFDGGFGLPMPTRRIHLAEAGGRIYFADRALVADNLAHMRGWLGSQVIAGRADGSLLATYQALYDGATFVSVRPRPHPGGGAVFTRDGKWFYEFSQQDGLLYRHRVEELLASHTLGDTSVAPGSLSQRNFVQILADPQRDILYGLDPKNNQLVYIDTETLLPFRAEIVGSQPTEMALAPDGETMLVATFGATELALIDMDNRDKALKRTLVVPGNPFEIAVSSRGTAVYVEQDQVADMTLLSLDDRQVLDTLSDEVFQPDVTFDPSGQFVFAGESRGNAVKLHKFSVSDGTFSQVGISTQSFAAPEREIFYSQGAVFYAKRKFAAEDLEILGRFEEEIVYVTPNGRFAMSDERIYDARETESGDFFPRVDTLPTESGLITASSDGQQLYQFDNNTGAIFVKELPAAE